MKDDDDHFDAILRLLSSSHFSLNLGSLVGSGRKAYPDSVPSAGTSVNLVKYVSLSTPWISKSIQMRPSLLADNSFFSAFSPISAEQNAASTGTWSNQLATKRRSVSE